MLAHYTQMPTIYQFYQALQVLRYVYSTRNSFYNFKRSEIPLHRNKFGLITEEVNITVYTDASRLPHTSQGGYFIFVNGHYAQSKSFRIGHNVSNSFQAELVALRNGLDAMLSVEQSLVDFGYRNIKMQMYCDNAPLVNIIQATNNKKPALSDLALRNCYNDLKNYYRDGLYTLSHVPGTENPADLLTKTLGMTTLQRLLNINPLVDVFTLVIEDDRLGKQERRIEREIKKQESELKQTNDNN